MLTRPASGTPSGRARACSRTRRAAAATSASRELSAAARSGRLVSTSSGRFCECVHRVFRREPCIESPILAEASMAHRITIEQHVQRGGRIRARSALREGYIIAVRLPQRRVRERARAKVLEGAVDYGGLPEEGASGRRASAQGKALFCQAKPLSDLVIEVPRSERGEGHPDADAAVPVQKMEQRRRRRHVHAAEASGERAAAVPRRASTSIS